jgi:hypothetical protein
VLQIVAYAIFRLFGYVEFFSTTSGPTYVFKNITVKDIDDLLHKQYFIQQYNATCP